MVATESPAAAAVGRNVLEHGGNAIDAAVSTVFALGVARPQSCGIGGGGFMVYRDHDGSVSTLDFRETAPAAIKSDTFTGPGLYQTFTGHTTVGVPGVVAGMNAALKRFGTISLRRAIAPAEHLAQDGFTVLPSLADSITANENRIKLFPATADAVPARGRHPVRGGRDAAPAGHGSHAAADHGLRAHARSTTARSPSRSSPTCARRSSRAKRA